MYCPTTLLPYYLTNRLQWPDLITWYYLYNTYLNTYTRAPLASNRNTQHGAISSPIIISLSHFIIHDTIAIIILKLQLNNVNLHPSNLTNPLHTTFRKSLNFGRLFYATLLIQTSIQANLPSFFGTHQKKCPVPIAGCRGSERRIWLSLLSIPA